MKTSKRILAILLGVIAIVSMMAVSVAASNYTDITIYNFSIKATEEYVNPARKEDTSPLYVYITDATYNQTIRVSAYGYTYGSYSAPKTNLTVNGYGHNVYSVSILPYHQYLIRSDIYEEGYPYAGLGFSTPVSGGMTINGYWSADSIGSYPYAY